MIVALPDLQNAGLTGERRLGELESLVRRAVGEHAAEMVVFPELSACGYPALQDMDGDRRMLARVSEPLEGGPSFVCLHGVARELGCEIVYGFSELDGGRLFNCVAHVGPSGLLGRYRKVHLTPAEQGLWSAGERVEVHDAGLGRVGMSSCYDKMFPELYLRQRERGAGASVVVSAWSSYRGEPGVSGWDGQDLWADHSELCDRARAVETGMAVISTNYSGPKVPGSRDFFCGGRRVIDGLGRLVSSRGSDEIRVWGLDVAASASDVASLNGGDFFARDRRRFH